MMNILAFKTAKLEGRKISMVTCYDYAGARLIGSTDVDCVLIGDSLAMVVHGFPSTLNATVEMMELHTAAVARGLTKKLIVADMPFLSYRKDLATAVEAAGRLMRAGAHAIKLEGARGNLEIVRHLVDSGIPVMGHLGLTPQSVNQLGGYRVQGKTHEEHESILNDALALEEAGCFSVVLECVPTGLGAEVSTRLKIPTIGIGAGLDCDGQVLVFHDLLGLNDAPMAKFVRQYGRGFEDLKPALQAFHKDVQERRFPAEKETYK